MKHPPSYLKRRQERGASLVEVAILVGLVIVVAIFALRDVGYSTFETNYVAACSLACAHCNWYVARNNFDGYNGDNCTAWSKKCRILGGQHCTDKEMRNFFQQHCGGGQCK